jgi:hypothetical protein
MSTHREILPDSIKSILLKYYDGLTSIEEERLLKDYFGKQPIPESNLADKTLLSITSNEEVLFIPNSEIWESINLFEVQKARRRKNIRLFMSTAASLLLIFSLGIGYNIYSSKKNMLPSDTYKSPEEAYKTVQKYLGLVSSKLSYAYTEMRPMEKLSIPGETMQSFIQIDNNFQKLKQLDRFSTATREIVHLSIISEVVAVENN